ncbi:coproporphyrinogen III oxidase [Sulfurimonas marina]|uniref:coproporphyrinogen oxidase n=1 Tax=Sulfurimonas marina TaxID=2590551 RepID=A0A7M1AX74_9BACT|nr:coproporphyrinogen III oxidase [Sulfurimonas marina]QOP41188.1 coproporphyrinogen III oxidase [Sulfurimonas marina]
MVYAKSEFAKDALAVVEELQSYFATKLGDVSKQFGSDKPFERVEWLRDNGTHGGGSRYEARDEEIFNRGSVNVSQVHYDDDATKKLSSATAISTIIHPKNPRVPSMHMHISLTEMRDGKMYWRLMADLNPSIVNEADQEAFDAMLQDASGPFYEEGSAQGDRYFAIPVLNRTRGVSHFYLENFSSGDFVIDKNFALSFGKKVIDKYIEIISNAIQNNPEVSEEDKKEQLAYHTTYLFQVLTLDRGTTSGLLVHNQNDVGIMGSIPAQIDVELLKSWIELMPKPQDKLVEDLVVALGGSGIVDVDEAVKTKLANAVREHYKKNPEAISMQASGAIIPPTVANHGSLLN